MKWNDLTMKERSDLMSLFLKAGVGSLSDMKHIYDGTKDTEGGYSEDTLEKRREVHSKHDPTGGWGIERVFYSNGNQAEGEEDQYWRAYLGLDNIVPKMNPKAKTSWDDKIEYEKAKAGEPPSEFYGTTPKMDQYIQAIADTTNTGKIVRNYDEYKKRFPNLSSKTQVEYLYRAGKKVMDNPNRWTQVSEKGERFGRTKDERRAGQFVLKKDLENNEIAPLGMLANFGMMWDPDEKALYIHDTYDFPTIPRTLGGIPERPREMKIRGRISYDPKKGSYLLRDDMKNFNNGAKGIGMSDLY